MYYYGYNPGLPGAGPGGPFEQTSMLLNLFPAYETCSSGEKDFYVCFIADHHPPHRPACRRAILKPRATI